MEIYRIGKYEENNIVDTFLRAIAECFARLSHRLGVRLSVCLSARHTRELYQNGAR